MYDDLAENVDDPFYDGKSIGEAIGSDLYEFEDRLGNGRELDWFKRLRRLVRQLVESMHGNDDWNKVGIGGDDDRE